MALCVITYTVLIGEWWALVDLVLLTETIAALPKRQRGEVRP